MSLSERIGRLERVAPGPCRACDERRRTIAVGPTEDGPPTCPECGVELGEPLHFTIDIARAGPRPGDDAD